MRTSTLRPMALALGTSLALLGCGAPPPQVPGVQANRVSSALTGIAEACGEAYQQGIAHSKHPDLTSIEATATMRAQELAKVFNGDPEGIYQAQTLRQIVAQGIAYLHECGLTQAAAALERQTLPKG